MNQSKKLLRTGTEELKLAQRSLDAVTGGQSYPQVTITFLSTDPAYVGLIGRMMRTKNIGEFDYQVGKVNGDCHSFLPLDVIAEGSSGPIQAGMMNQVHGNLAPALEGITHYRINMKAKNGIFQQCLDVRYSKTAGHWVSRSVIWLGNFVVAVEDWPLNE
jgi:hypothetical protein